MPARPSSDFLSKFIQNQGDKKRVNYPRYLSLNILKQLIQTEIREIELCESSFKNFVDNYKPHLIFSDDCVCVKLNPVFRIFVSNKFRKGRPRSLKGREIRELKNYSELGLTQVEIAKKTGIPQYKISRYLKKLRCDP